MYGKKREIGNKWCKIMTVYSKEMKTTRRGVEDTIKENRKNLCSYRGKRLKKMDGKY
jgi:hypothetical protein